MSLIVPEDYVQCQAVICRVPVVSMTPEITGPDVQLHVSLE
jgi:hypothetical protein